MPHRPDATLAKNVSKFREAEFHIMHGRTESAIFSHQTIDLTHTMEYLDKVNTGLDEKKLSLFQIILTAGVRAITLRPHLNCFVANRRLWQRNTITFAFVVKKEKTDEGIEVNAMIDFDPYDTLETVAKRVNDNLYEARHGENKNEQDVNLLKRLPRFVMKFIFWFLRRGHEKNHPLYSMTKTMPLFATVFFAHLGSIGLDAIYHHPFELGNVGLFLVLGQKRWDTVVDQETKEVMVHEVMDIKYTLDDRITEGVYVGKALNMMKNFIENPEKLEKPPELTQKQLDALALKAYTDLKGKKT